MRPKTLSSGLRPFPLLLSFLLLASLLAGCGQSFPPPSITAVHTLPGPPNTPRPSTSSKENGVPKGVGRGETVTLFPSSTSPLPSLTPTFTLTLTSTQTATPTITATTNPEPMSIEAARTRSYPGSDITIDSELSPGSSYHRYYTWYLSDGLKIYGLLTVPNGTMPEGGWPAIVFNHGFIPPYLYSTAASYAAHIDSLASHGYVVFKPDYRGNGWSEGGESFVYGDPGYTDDVLNALASLKRYPKVNPQKIGMWGHSMGGFLTLRAMVISKDVKVGVIWAGVVGSYADMICCWYAHPLIFPTPLPGSHTGWQSWIQDHGTPDQNPQFWDSISATSYLADLSGPLQLHHDLYDYEVPYAFSESAAAKAQAAGKSVELYSYPTSDHNLNGYYVLAMDRTIQFFDQILK